MRYPSTHQAPNNHCMLLVRLFTNLEEVEMDGRRNSALDLACCADAVCCAPCSRGLGHAQHPPRRHHLRLPTAAVALGRGGSIRWHVPRASIAGQEGVRGGNLPLHQISSFDTELDGGAPAHHAVVIAASPGSS